MSQFLNITIGQIIGGFAGIFILLSCLIEISPIKINPLGWVGERINGKLINKIDTLEEDVTKIKDDAAKRYAVDCRTRILIFGDEVRRGVLHSKEHFDQVLEDIDNYEKYCDEHPRFKNNKTVVTTSMILGAYTHCVEKNSFL